MPEYSVKYPETSSLSASGRSNGMRLLSAIAAVKNKKNASGWTKMPHAFSPCHRTMSSRRIEP